MRKLIKSILPEVGVGKSKTIVHRRRSWRLDREIFGHNCFSTNGRNQIIQDDGQREPNNVYKKLELLEESSTRAEVVSLITKYIILSMLAVENQQGPSLGRTLCNRDRTIL